MVAILVTFEIMFGISAILILTFVILGLSENSCWIFDDEWWENSRKTKELETRVASLEERLKENNE